MFFPFAEKRFPFNEKDFLKAMFEVDQELIKEGIEPNRRILFVLSKLQEKLPELLTVPIPLRSCSKEFDGSFTNLNLFGQIEIWYKLRYGDKTNMGHLATIGEMILLIENEPFKTICPDVLGTVIISWDILSKRIEGLTPFRSQHLNTKEIIRLLDIYCRTSRAFIKYDELGLCYKKEAINDLHRAVDGIINSDGYGQSKWDTLQFTEKVLKGVIIYITNQKANKTHDLIDLAKFLPKKFNINEYYLNKINDNAGIRYGEKSISRNEAIEAHVASMKIFRDIMNALSSEVDIITRSELFETKQHLKY